MIDPAEMQNWIERQLDGARVRAEVGDVIQTLWSGFGELRRVRLPGHAIEAAVLKWVDPAAATAHPRGWHGEVGQARKLRSYAVEIAFYTATSSAPPAPCRTARCLAASAQGAAGFAVLLEDLDAAGFSARPASGDVAAVRACLDWLAAFHAHHLGTTPTDLWPVGCYWHLGTRDAEWQAMPEGALKQRAGAIDSALNSARWQTRVHGDAKLANFCLDSTAGCAAAVDFQYVGGGVGVRDLVALFASAFDNAMLFEHADALLDYYFDRLRAGLAGGVDAAAVDAAAVDTAAVDTDAVEAEWRALWPLVWADYLRFLDGWMPGHARRTEWADARVAEALARC